jgi:hypothetical protein
MVDVTGGAATVAGWGAIVAYFFVCRRSRPRYRYKVMLGGLNDDGDMYL